MPKTIMVCGYGPGISESVARKFGSEGFQVALVARSADKLESGAAALNQAGVKARGFSCDLSDPAALRKLLPQVRAAFGPITVLHWNAHSTAAGDLLTAEPPALQKNIDVAVTGLVTALQETLQDLRASGAEAAVLVTGGKLSEYSPGSDALAAQWGVMGLAVAKAAQHKLVGVLHAKLKSEGIFVGEVTVGGIVKSTGGRHGTGTIEASDVAQRFWDQYRARTDAYLTIP